MAGLAEHLCPYVLEGVAGLAAAEGPRGADLRRGHGRGLDGAVVLELADLVVGLAHLRRVDELEEVVPEGAGPLPHQQSRRVEDAVAVTERRWGVGYTAEKDFNFFVLPLHMEESVFTKEMC